MNTPTPATFLATVLDPAKIFARAGLDPDDYQSDLLRSEEDALVNCGRQVGKSTTAAGIAGNTAISIPKSTTLLLSPSQRQSGELFLKVKQFLAQLDGLVTPEKESALRLELPNGSRIISLPGREETVRGYSAVDLLLLDEASRIDDELYRAVRPMLATSGGRIIAMSTPNGKSGFFHDEWHNGGQRWERFEVPASECSRISEEFLEAERASMPEAVFRQEYCCSFEDNADQFFATDLVQRAISKDIAPVFDQPLAWGSGVQRLGL